MAQSTGTETVEDTGDDIIVVGRPDSGGGGGFDWGWLWGSIISLPWAGDQNGSPGAGSVDETPPPAPIDQLQTAYEAISQAIDGVNSADDAVALIQALAGNPNIALGNFTLTTNTLNGAFFIQFTVTSPGQAGGIIVSLSSATAQPVVVYHHTDEGFQAGWSSLQSGHEGTLVAGTDFGGVPGDWAASDGFHFGADSGTGGTSGEDGADPIGDASAAGGVDLSQVGGGQESGDSYALPVPDPDGWWDVLWQDPAFSGVSYGVLV